MVETPRKRKVTTDFSVDRIVDKKRRNKQPRMALPIDVPISSTVESRSPVEEDDEDGLPPINFLPRVVRTQIQRSISDTAATHDSVPTPDRSVVTLSSPISEQRRPPVYVVEEEDSRRHGTSEVVDLTVDTGEIVDLTSNCNNSVVIITPEQEFLNERPSCRYSGVQITGEKRPSVIKVSAPKEPKKKAANDKEENGNTKTGIDVTCPICLDKAEQFRSTGRTLVSTVCGHLFCDDCIKKTVQELHQCPTCRKKLTRKSYHPVYI